MKDDNDLEFEHFVNVALDSGSVTPPGIALPGTQVLTIIDDGKCKIKRLIPLKMTSVLIYGVHF